MNNPESISKLHFYTYGTVAANKELSSDMIEVIPHEQSPYLDGYLTDNIQETQGSGTDKDGSSFEAKAKTTASIKAKWLSFTDTNRITSPDVRRGEEVVVWQFADTDQYWWTTLHQDKKIRRLETVIYGFSNNSKENIENAHDSMYWLEISTHRKIVRFHTSKNDGEPFTYDIQLNTKEGNFTIEDDDGNYIFLDSKQRQIKLRNKDDSYIFMDKKDITIHSLERVDIKTRHFSVEAKESITTNTVTEKSKADKYSIDNSSFSHNSGAYSVKVPTAKFSSTVTAGTSMKTKAYYGSIDYAPHPR